MKSAIKISTGHICAYIPGVAKARSRYHHGDLRRAFLDQAAKLVEVEGVGALTLREIARRVGVSHAASTNHFADKAALLEELAADGFEELAADLATASHARSATVSLREIGRAYVRFALRRPGHFRVMFGQHAPAVSESRLAIESQRAYAVLERAVVALLPPARARSAARVWEAAFYAWSVVHGAATLMLDSPQEFEQPPSEKLGVVEFSLDAVVQTLSGER